MKWSNSLFQQFFVIISETSYIEQSQTTNYFIRSFMEFFRYYSSDKQTATLYEELKTADRLKKIFTSVDMLRSLEIPNRQEYDNITIQRCFVIEWLWNHYDLLTARSQEYISSFISVDPVRLQIDVIGITPEGAQDIILTGTIR
ncbi:hypothetical protein [uncultured Robinsoniella sp.]|uniref:hypothetical protein n=1 Tax=uncultured Robinsoniella sp. TaxID=904190 RepID=UPI00374E5DDC